MKTEILNLFRKTTNYAQQGQNRIEASSGLTEEEKYRTSTFIEYYIHDYFHTHFRHPNTNLTLDQRSKLKGRTGVMSLTYRAYIMMLDEAGMLPKIASDTKTENAFEILRDVFNKFFLGKNVYFLPGRYGQEAIFSMEHGATAGISTDFRYIQDAKDNLINLSRSENPASTINKTSMLVESPLNELIYSFADYRADLAIKPHKKEVNPSIKIHKMTNPYPDIVFCGNMFNVTRFQPDNGSSYVGKDWRVAINRLLALGTLNTIFYIIPSFGQTPCFFPDTLSREIGDYAIVKGFKGNQNLDTSFSHSQYNQLVSVRLTKPVPSKKLEL